MSELNKNFDQTKIKEEKLKLLQQRLRNGKSYSINLIHFIEIILF